MVAELYNIFDNYDKIARYNAELYSFVIIIIKNESFDQFYVRFSVIIISLSYNKVYKIFNLKRLIIIKLRSRIVGLTLLLYQYFVEYLRKID